MLDLVNPYFSVFGLATECRKHIIQEATLSDSYLNIRKRTYQCAMWKFLSGLTCTQMLAVRISSPSESKADLNKLLRSYPTGLAS